MAEPTPPSGDVNPRVVSDTGPFSIIPEWVLDSGVSARAIQLYAILGRYADRKGDCFPSRRKLAQRMGDCPLKAVDRATKELVEIGALGVTHRVVEGRGKTTNLYSIVRARPLVLSLASDTSDIRASDTSDIKNENQGERESPTDSGVPHKSDSKGDLNLGETSGRPRNVVWEALDEIFHPSTPSERSNVGKTERELRAAMDGRDEPSMALEIERRVAAYWPDLTISPQALRKNWSELGRRSDEKPRTRESAPCRVCNGTGSEPGSSDPYDCEVCRGTGIESWVPR